MGEKQKRRPQRRASPDLRKALCEVYVAGAPVRALCIRTGLSYGTVHRILSGEGVLRPPGGHRDGGGVPPHIAAMIAGLPIAPIAKPHNILADTLAAIVKDYAADTPIDDLTKLMMHHRDVLRLMLADLDDQISTSREDNQ